MRIISNIILSLFLSSYLFGQIPGSPLKIEGRYIKNSSGLKFQIKAVNINDYMEHYYNPWGNPQTFQEILSWLHTVSDYTRIKQLGFNTVRLNICPSHINLIPNLQRVKDHIEWAKQNSLF